MTSTQSDCCGARTLMNHCTDCGRFLGSINTIEIDSMLAARLVREMDKRGYTITTEWLQSIEYGANFVDAMEKCDGAEGRADATDSLRVACSDPRVHEIEDEA